ncbi:MAG: hypothetical protein ABW048_09040 [Sphingobium sp.]
MNWLCGDGRRGPDGGADFLPLGTNVLLMRWRGGVALRLVRVR